MAEKITVNVPHKLSREGARERISQGFSKVQEQIASSSVDISNQWDGDRMKFKGSSMGQSLTGELIVHDDKVTIEVDLPWFLGKISGVVKEKLKKGTALLLEKK